MAMKKFVYLPLVIAVVFLWSLQTHAETCTTDDDCQQGYMCINGNCANVMQDGDIESFELEAEAVEFESTSEEDVSESASTEDETQSANNTPTGKCSNSSDCPTGYACFDGICLYTDCIADKDCPAKHDVCLDNGFCVPETCNQDSDCRYPDMICRDDLQCAPKICKYDTDCSYYSYCSNGTCAANPAFYVHGKGGCESTNTNGMVLSSIVFGLLLFRGFRRKFA